MYNQGDVKVVDGIGYFDGKKVFQLPHSCGEWIIGGKEEAEQLIKDLQEAIKERE